MPAKKVFELSYAWAKEYQPQLAELFAQDEFSEAMNKYSVGKKKRKTLE